MSEIIDCTCTWDEHGHLATYCGCCGSKRTPEPRATVEKLYVRDAVCQCVDAWTGKPLRHRHATRELCIPAEDVEVFAQAQGLKDLGHARALLYLSTFAPSSLQTLAMAVK